MTQWLRLWAPNAGGLSWILGWGARSPKPQLKILHTARKIQHSQINKWKGANVKGTSKHNFCASSGWDTLLIFQQFTWKFLKIDDTSHIDEPPDIFQPQLLGLWSCFGMCHVYGLCTSTIHFSCPLSNLRKCELKLQSPMDSSHSTETYLSPWLAELRWTSWCGNGNYLHCTSILHLSWVYLWILQAHLSPRSDSPQAYLRLKADKKRAQFRLWTDNGLQWSVLLSPQTWSHEKYWAWKAFLEWQRERERKQSETKHPAQGVPSANSGLGFLYHCSNLKCLPGPRDCHT